VEQQHGRTEAPEIMLDRKNLPSITQRVLRQEADLREAVDDDPFGLRPLDRIEYQLDRFTEFEIGRVKQRLLLIPVEERLRGREFKDLDVGVKRPAMGRS